MVRQWSVGMFLFVSEQGKQAPEENTTHRVEAS